MANKTLPIRVVICTVLITAAPFLASAEDVNYGLKMFTKAGKGLCWIEKLHKLPPIKKAFKNDNWGSCELNVKWGDNEWEEQYKIQADHQKKRGENPDTMKPFLTKSAMDNLKMNIKHRFNRLPSDYRAACETFVDHEKQEPAKDFSSFLRDSSGGDYPFKGLAHCFLEVAERRNGKEATAALQSHWTTPKSFHQAIIDRENENRARHGTPPLTLDSELNTRAQRWAEKLAAANFCKMKHIKKIEPTNPDIKYKDGKDTGENIGENGYKDGGDGETGMNSANGWYTEVLNYPWPAYNGHNNKGVIGHFTQSVWKSSQLAGYGIARSPGCDKVFVVARYFPGGNMRHQDEPQYREYNINVLPPV